MNESWPKRQRRRVGFGMLAFGGVWVFWMVGPGMPVLRGPSARAEVKLAGLNLFVHEWRPHDPQAHGDGLGPVFNARSCVACHFQGGVGGGGSSKENVLAYEALPTPGRPVLKTGLIHKFAVEDKYSERSQLLDTLFPTVPKGLTVHGVCFTEKRDFNPVRTQGLNSTALFGAGWIDKISEKAIQHLWTRRSVDVIGKELSGDFASIPLGRPRILPDGRIGKFGWKAQFATLEEFVAAACANEIGLGTPGMEQAKPLRCSTPTKVDPDLDKTQFRALLAYVTTLPRPEEVRPDNPGEQSRVDHGKALFAKIGCAACHVPDVGGVTGVYSDFLLHRIVDNFKNYAETAEVSLPPEHPLPEVWKTPALWGVADSAPYFHDGASPTLDAAIQRHGGDSGAVTEAYRKLSADDRATIVRFLESLKAPAEATPARPEAQGQLAMAR